MMRGVPNIKTLLVIVTLAVALTSAGLVYKNVAIIQPRGQIGNIINATESTLICIGHDDGGGCWRWIRPCDRRPAPEWCGRTQ